MVIWSSTLLVATNQPDGRNPKIITDTAAGYLEKGCFCTYRTLILCFIVEDEQSNILSKVCDHYGILFMAFNTGSWISHAPNS